MRLAAAPAAAELLAPALGCAAEPPDAAARMGMGGGGWGWGFE